jgi:drug/metabolite transporter (DMT)-like permease
LEAVFTVLLSWLVFREPLGPRVIAAVVAMAMGGVILVRAPGAALDVGAGGAAIVLATLAWALDNVVARPLADLDPTHVVRWKSGLGASVAFVLARLVGETFPRVWSAIALLGCGLTGYGLSLRLYLLAQRTMGAARTGSIFALAPFIGAGAAWILGARDASGRLGVSFLFFAAGVYLHVTESHRHPHTHHALEHDHAHRHDDGHHDHAHDPPVVGEHSHAHRHDEVTHSHEHGPDVHHTHRHE